MTSFTSNMCIVVDFASHVHIYDIPSSGFPLFLLILLAFLTIEEFDLFISIICYRRPYPTSAILSSSLCSSL